MDFDQCVLQEHEYCRFRQDESVEMFSGHRGQMSQFCGHEEKCKQFNNPDSLQQAKKNVEKYYPVVGVTEYMNRTLEVLEHRLPEFFPNARERMEFIYKLPGLIRNTNHIKVPVNNEVLEKIKPKFAHEYEFYEFCKQRLFIQWSNLGIK